MSVTVSPLGSASSATAGTVLTISVTGPVAVGDTILVRIATAYTTGTPTVTIKGTVYSTATRTSAVTGNVARNTTYVIQATAALVAGDTITITNATAVAGRVAVAEKYTGLTGAVDVQNGAAGTASGIGTDNSSSITSVTPATVLVECLYSVEPSTNPYVLPPDWRELARAGTTGAATNVTSAACSRQVLAAGTYTVSAQLTAGVLYQFHMFALTVAAPPAVIAPTPPAGSPFVRSHGTAQTSASGSYLQVALTNDVPAGDTLIVRFAHEYTSGTDSCSDPQGNTYVVDRSSPSAGAGVGTGIRVTLLRCYVVAALQSGDKLTIRCSAVVGPKTAAVAQFTGLQNALSGAPNGHNGTGAGNTVTGSSYATVDDNAVQLNAVGSIEPGGQTLEVSPAYQALPRVGTAAGTNNVSLAGGWKSAMKAGSYNFNIKLTSGVVYTMLLAAYPVAGGLPLEPRNYNQLVGDLGATAYFKLDTAGYADTIDGSRRATAHGGVTVLDAAGTGPVAALDAYAVLDGAVGSYLQIPDDDDFSIDRGGGDYRYSVAIWMRPDTLDNTNVEGADPPTGQGRYAHWAGKGEKTPAAYEWVLRMYNQHQADGTTLLPDISAGGRRNRVSAYAFNVTGGLGAGSYTPQQGDSWLPTAGGWTFVVATYGPVGTSMFRDGQWRDSDFYSDYSITPTNTAANVRLGSRDGIDSFWKGALQGFAVFDHALTDDEVYRLYQSRLNAVAQPVAMQQTEMAPPPIEDPTPPAELLPEPFADDLYQALQPLTRQDPYYKWSLLILCNAIGTMYQLVDSWVRDTDAGPGWSLLLDINRSPPEALDWLGQFVGVRIPAGLDDAAQRQWIRDMINTRRGTPAAITRAVQATLTGTKTVQIVERDPAATDPPYALTITTLTTETPDPAATLRAMVAAKPAGLTLNQVAAVTGIQTWDQFKARSPSWDGNKALYTSWQRALLNQTP